MPILGSDFLCHHHSLVNIAGSSLLDASSLEPIPAVSPVPTGSSSNLHTALLSTSEEFRDLLEYPDVISSKGFSATVLKHPVRHSVRTVPGRPVFAKARRLDAEKLKSARKEFAAMEAAGVIPRSNSSWASPFHMVQKPDGSWRSCGNYCRLNTQTVLDRYPLPKDADFTSHLQGCKIITKLDLTKGYSWAKEIFQRRQLLLLLACLNGSRCLLVWETPDEYFREWWTRFLVIFLIVLSTLMTSLFPVMMQNLISATSARFPTVLAPWAQY